MGQRRHEPPAVIRLRKMFLVLVMAGLVARCAFAQSCSLDPDRRATNAEVLVLGAGISGVAAARTLEVNGISDFLVLEANDRIGGRIREYDGTSIELGANWISGLDLSDPMHHPIWREWTACDEDGPDGSVTPEHFIGVFDIMGNPYDITDKNGTYKRRKEVFQTAYNKVAELAKTITPSIDISIRKALTKEGWEPQSVLDNFTEWVTIDWNSAQKPEELSLLHYFPLATYTIFLGPEKNATAVDYLVADKKGYSFVVECLARNFKNDRVLLNSLITKIETADDCVCVTVQENVLYCGSHAIVTFSIGALQAALRGDENAVHFEPPLPQTKQDAINSITAIQYTKIYLQFEASFWEESDATQQTFGYVSDEKGYYAYFIVDKHRPNTLAVDVTEDLAVTVASQSEEITVYEIMTILRKIFGKDIPEPQNAFISKWSVDPLFLGAYTELVPGVPEQVFNDILEPVNGRLYFAGESLNTTDIGYTHSGYGSGAYVAKQVLSSFMSLQPDKHQ